MEFEGIVFRLTPYSEYDAMVSVLSLDRIHTFLARGVFKYGSKTASSINLYSFSKFQVFKGKEGFFLRNSEPINNFCNLKNGIDKLAIIDFVGELTNKVIIDEDATKIYEFLKKTIESIDSGFDPLTAGLIYFAKVLNAIGLGLNVDSCIKCSKTASIVGVNYLDGGFVCEICFNALNHVKCSPHKLKIIRYIFQVDLLNFEKIRFLKEECLELIEELSNFLFDKLQVELKSLTLLRNI